MLRPTDTTLRVAYDDGATSTMVRLVCELIVFVVEVVRLVGYFLLALRLVLRSYKTHVSKCSCKLMHNPIRLDQNGLSQRDVAVVEYLHSDTHNDIARSSLPNPTTRTEPYRRGFQIGATLRGFSARTKAAMSGVSVFSWAIVIRTFCILSVCGMRLAKDVSDPVIISEDSLLAIASFMFFVYFLFFLRVSKDAGVLMIVVQKILFGDLRRWIIIALMFILGLGQALYVLRQRDSVSWGESVAATFLMGIGQSNAESFATEPPVLGSVLFVVSSIILPLLLLNVLIALMNSSYEDIMTRARSEWQLQV